MAYSAYQWRAISHYLKKNNLIPQLSAFPVIRYVDRQTREPGEAHINHIEDIYVADRERVKREARSEARQAKRQKIDDNSKKYIKG